MPDLTFPNLEKLFSPSSIAVIGASRNQKKIGYITVKNIKDAGFEGEIYPVNPNADSILGLKCYNSIASLPQNVDMAVVALPSQIVLETLKQLNAHKIKDVVVFSAGFKEIGEEGLVLEKNLKKFAKKNAMNVLGPNCLGFANTISNINATFGTVANVPGNLKFISQSGAIAASLFDWFEHSKLGFSDFVTLGNKTVLNENDILGYWLDYKMAHKNLDGMGGFSKYQPIGLYLESVSKGKTFLELCSKITPFNPVFVLKPGKSDSAKKAMQSHTGALAGEDSVLEIALKEVGAIRCSGLEDMFDLARTFAWTDVPEGPNVAVVSNAGGPAVISADLISDAGLKLVSLSDATHSILEKHLPRSASIINPVDVLGDALADRYKYAVDAVLQEEAVHSVIVILTPQVMTEIEETAEVIGDLVRKHKKPVLCAFIGGTQVAAGEKVLNKYKIPSFHFPDRAIRTLSKMWWWANWVEKNEENIEQFIVPQSEAHLAALASKVLATAKERKRNTLNSFEANEILEVAGIKTPKTWEVASFVEADNFGKENGYPVVLKLSSHKLLHKTEMGAVITGIDSKERLEEAFKEISDHLKSLDPKIKKSAKIQIQKQVPQGVELIVGVKRDPSFGAVLMFGAGGTLAELIKDRNLALVPVSSEKAKQLVEGSKVYKLLKGFRGRDPYALKELYSLIERISTLAVSVPYLNEFEINPVILTHEEVWAVDGKGVL